VQSTPQTTNKIYKPIPYHAKNVTVQKLA